MELFDALGPAVGSRLADKRGSVPRKLLLAGDAAPALARELLEESPGRDAVVLFDLRTRAAAGEACLRALRDAGFAVHELLVPDVHAHEPACDDATIAELKAKA